MRTVYKRAPVLPLGADPDFSLEAGIDAAQLGARKARLALRHISNDRIEHAIAELEQAVDQLQHSALVLDYVFGDCK